MVPQKTCTLLKSDITSRLEIFEQEIVVHPIVNHPFLSALRSGAIPAPGFKLWLTQQYWFSSQFPRCLAALYARIEDFEVSRPLMKFLAIEHWGSDYADAHWMQFQDALAYFDLNVSELKHSCMLEETQAYLDLRLDMCLRGRAEEALGVISFGHELINSQIFAAYLQGMESLPNVTERALHYFRSHVADEVEDYAILKALMVSYFQTSSSVDLAIEGAREVLAARYLFFDRIYSRLENLGLVNRTALQTQ